MKIFNGTFAEYFGCFIIVLLSYFLTRSIVLFFDFTDIVWLVLYLIVYLIILSLCLKMLKLSFDFAFNKKYKISIFILLFVFWFNISYSIKFIRIMTMFIQNRNFEKLPKYFNDGDQKVQYISLALCAFNCDVSPVNKWFEENYIRKNLPIDSFFYPIYVAISTPNTKE